MKGRIFILSYFMILLCGCVIPKAQKGGKWHSTALGNTFSLEQGENPQTPSKAENHRSYERTFTIPQGSEVVSYALPDNSSATETNKPAAPNPARPATVFRLSQPMLVHEKEVTGAAVELGSSWKDEARAWAAKAAAMRPVQWVGIALVVGSIAAFYFGWPSLGLMAIAVGGGMIVLAAVVPGHEALILSVGGIGLGIVALVMAYAYHKGNLDANHNWIPDFLEKRDAQPK